MNLRFIGARILLMIDFFSHSSFNKEIAGLKRRFNHIEDGIDSFKKLCEVQFHPESPRQIISPGKLHRVTQNDIWALWKIELAVKGIRSNKSPRVWFAIKGTTIVFLSAQTHSDNYSDNKINIVASDRASEFF